MNQREPGYDSPALASYCKTSDTLQDSLAKFLMQILIKNAIENRTPHKNRLIYLTMVTMAPVSRSCALRRISLKFICYHLSVPFAVSEQHNSRWQLRLLPYY